MSPDQPEPFDECPDLSMVLMAEQFIKASSGEYKKRELWEALPKKMMYQTFKAIIDYLLESRKISVDSEGKIGWIYYPDEAKRYYEQEELGRNR